jgi:hypothetical protein
LNNYASPNVALQQKFSRQGAKAPRKARQFKLEINFKTLAPLHLGVR